MYGAFSKFYDSFTDDVDYIKIARRYEEIFEKLKYKPSEILDLGCGTGSLTLEMARRGYDMTGVDISGEMLEVAINKAKETNDKDTLFINQDITCLDLYGTVDAVVSSLDVVNHLLTKNELVSCFKGVSLFLVPKGIFIFDINTPYKFENEYCDKTYVFENENATCIWQNNFDSKSKICDFYLTFFEKKDNLYEKFTDACSERMYTLEEIEQALKRANMKILKIYNENLKPLKNNNSRAIIVALNEKIK